MHRLFLTASIPPLPRRMSSLRISTMTRQPKRPLPLHPSHFYLPWASPRTLTEAPPPPPHTSPVGQASASKTSLHADLSSTTILCPLWTVLPLREEGCFFSLSPIPYKVPACFSIFEGCTPMYTTRSGAGALTLPSLLLGIAPSLFPQTP